MTTRGSSGHVGPLTPFGHACLRAGHEVLVAAQHQYQANVERVRLPFAPVAQPDPEDWMPLMGEFSQLDFDAANQRMVGEFFGRLDTAAALPGLAAIVDDWHPDVIVRESWEYAGALVAEQRGIPLARIGLGLAAVEELTIGWAAAGVDASRAELGLPADPSGERLRDAPYLTTIPAPLEDPAVPQPRVTRRFRAGAVGSAAPLPADWWPGNDDPLVYATFGSVTAAPHLPYYPALYRALIDALAPLPLRLLVTVGEPRDLSELGPLPRNVRVEHWVPQDDVAPHAAAIVCHGGHGSTLGALAHGVPLVVVPLFSVDQVANGAAVARAGAGVTLDGDIRSRRALDPPGASLDGLAPAVSRLLAGGGHRAAPQGIAEAMRGLPPAEAAVGVLEALTRH